LFKIGSSAAIDKEDAWRVKALGANATAWPIKAMLSKVKRMTPNQFMMVDRWIHD
jgi:hypothetical protein